MACDTASGHKPSGIVALDSCCETIALNNYGHPWDRMPFDSNDLAGYHLARGTGEVKIDRVWTHVDIPHDQWSVIHGTNEKRHRFAGHQVLQSILASEYRKSTHPSPFQAAVIVDEPEDRIWFPLGWRGEPEVAEEQLPNITSTVENCYQPLGSVCAAMPVQAADHG